MTRPHIVRADTIDLQDHDAPSAKNHSHVPAKPDSNGNLAAHQAETLREVAEERAGEEMLSPRASWAPQKDTGDLSQYAEDPGMDDMATNSKNQREDALAAAQNGGSIRDADDRDADSDHGDDDMDDDMMDKISSSPSIEDEDIDFEFVYALHTFVATVEGQANATKGDTMVLLDDSNSYWWLVRVVKDSSIGYLPAEHIETPTERLARLNKHRNIDLSASMLGDTAEKTKNPIKTAIRRRKAKTVAFAPPTYVDYSDHDVSSDEGGDDDDDDERQQAAQQRTQVKQAQVAAQQMGDNITEDDESAKVEPLKPRAQQKQAKTDTATTSGDVDSDEDAMTEEPRGSEDMDGKTERITRNGTVRNTDSFFRDETIETKKITLTPGLLRDDTEPRGSNSSDSKEIRQRPSLDRFEKELVSDREKVKEDKKRKDKKPSVIRSFFSRKDKKRSGDDDDESFGKRSMDAGAEYVEEDVQEVDSPDKNNEPQRNPSKLQKQPPRTETSPTRKQPNNVANAPPTSLRIVESEASVTPDTSDAKDDKSKSAISKMLHTNTEPKPPKVTKAKSRVELDDFDSSQEEDNIVEPASPSTPARQAPTVDNVEMRPTLPGSFPDSYIETPAAQRADPLALHASIDNQHADSAGVSPLNNPPALLGDTSSQEDRSSPISSPSPELDDIDTHTHRNQDSMATTASTATNATWNDASLRAFFDSGADIRDMLVVVNDTTDVPPAGPDHPMVSGLFREQNAKLAEITTQLDNMLGDWLARKQRVRGTL
ncbi:SH3 domain-containing protein [Microdochium nivale]|nr:SH3 domain-containing protein [Microdochium nivale]